MKKSLKKSLKFPCAGFTYVELVVALSIAAIVLTAAVMAYGTISGTRVVSIRSEVIRLASSTATNLYVSTNRLISVPVAPNYGSLLQAETMRERLYQDISTATANFLLGRDGLNTYRVEQLGIDFTNDGRRMLTPMAFRQVLPNANDYSATATNALQTVNSTLYVLNASTTNGFLVVRSTYETDFILMTEEPQGVYATVRRYEGFELTDYYHVFYPQTNTNLSFRPLGYVFNRGTVNDVSVDKPFYLMWWPDPSSPRLPDSSGSGQDRAGYTNMANQTPFFFVIPAFPAL